jgi:hypothetical protein
VGFDIIGAVDGDTFQKGFFISLGLSVVGFVATFFVAPQFKADLKEDYTWKEMCGRLRENGLKSFSPKEVQARHREGYVISPHTGVFSKRGTSQTPSRVWAVFSHTEMCS